MTTANAHAGIAGYTHVYEGLFVIGLVVGIIYLLISPLVSKLMHGVR